MKSFSALAALALATWILGAGPSPRALGAEPEAATRPAPDPMAAVRRLLEGIARFRDAGQPDSAAAAVRPLLDIEGLARFVLAAEWDRRSPAERTHFVELLDQLLARRAFPKAATFFQDVKVEYGAVKTRPDQSAEVETEVISPEEGTVLVAYRVTRSQGGWRIADVVLDGVSLRVNLRATSQKLIRDQGYSGLVENMQAKLKESE